MKCLSFVQNGFNNDLKIFCPYNASIKVLHYNRRVEGKALFYVTCVESENQNCMIFLSYIKRAILRVTLLKYIFVLLSKQ